MDLSILTTVNAPEKVSPSDYVPPTDYSEAAPVGDYTVRIIDGKFKDQSSGSEDPFRLSKTRNGDLQVEVALESVGDNLKGKRFYDRWNLAAFKNGKGNTFFNALFGFGFDQGLASPQDYIKALIQLIKSGATAGVFVNKEWYCNPKSTDYQGCGTSTKGDATNRDKLRIVCNGDAHNGGDAPVLLARNTLSKYKQVTV